ncbi:glycerophosphodiester phosphodiesterase [Paenibacillus sp. WQ 127069]|uniref:Glycerophosphodiester phosphodiesterase n=1 Tax=Paenibacillus baimaensis TaxID=2982185 RepID=A0ABT2UGG1_9BACL|nr:glycerophosphodiester phosphodiesterase [Paenibacillus sp. WQ 127069]MCU6793733.1 glycerophosphodiester phosphodiesterase [Paenibacillus sp. WQ 127069]
MEKPSFPKIAAHTGCGNAPDNTMESCMEGIQSGADIVEVDLRVAGDGTVILLHDDSPYLRECTYEQLNQYEIRTRLSSVYENYEIVKLADILQIAKQYDVQLNLDIKTVDTIEPVIQLVREYNMVDRVYITGCSENITNRYHDIQVVFNTPKKFTPEESDNYSLHAAKECEEAVLRSYYGLNMDYATCRQEIVELAHASGLAVWVYTVNDSEAMQSFIQMGVDAITTRDVTKLTELQKQGESRMID